MTVLEGECVGIVGESGCGKSTLARIITRLITPDHGFVKFCGMELSSKKRRELQKTYRDMKMIFQEPRSSFDPRLTLGRSMRDALKPVMLDKKSRRGKSGICLSWSDWMAAMPECIRGRSAAENASGRRSHGRSLKNPRFLIWVMRPPRRWMCPYRRRSWNC